MLELTGVSAFYGKSRVLTGVDLGVAPGQILALLGRNGSGRSTLAKAVMGLVERTGSIVVDGVETASLPPHKVVEAGVAYVPEGREVFATLTVDENLTFARRRAHPSAWTAEEVYDRFPNLARRKTVDAAVLSGGEKQILAICRSLLAAPSYLLIDEPTEGLAPQIVQDIAALILDIAERGAGVLLIEQKQAIALKVAHATAVLGKGEIVFRGSPEELQQNQEIRRAWLEI